MTNGRYVKGRTSNVDRISQFPDRVAPCGILYSG
jgi:hypothetical protein